MSYTITNITQAANAVVTVNATGSNPFATGNLLGFASVVGMTQINGTYGTCVAVGGSSGAFTATVNINSTAYTAYSSGGTVTILTGVPISGLPTGTAIADTDVFPWDQGTTTIKQPATALFTYFNKRTAAEIAAGVTPTNYAYPAGNILRYGADVTGATSSWTAFNNCVNVCKASGTKMIVPPGDYLIDTVNGTITLQYVTIQGTGVNDTYNVNSQGSVINITGTSVSPFKLQAGVTLDGLVFYYPNNVTDGTTPTVYPPTLSVDITNGPVNYVYIQNCTVVNAYRFFVDTDATGGLGHVFILNNTIYGILTCIEIAYNAEICTIEGNEFTFGAFNVAQLETNPSFRYTTRTTGTAIQVNRSDGLTIQGNVFFGYLNGIGLPLATGQVFQQCTIGNNYFDQTVFGINASGAGNFNIVQIVGNFMSGYDNVNAQHSTIGNCIKIATSGSVSLENVTISANSFPISTGDSINVSGNTATRSYSINGNVFSDWGTYQSTGGPYAAINFSGSGSSMQVNANSFNGCGGSVGICSGILGSCSTAVITGNEFIDTGAGALGITGTTSFSASYITLSGNISVGQSGGTYDDVVSATNLYEIGNQWGRPNRFSPVVVPLAAWFQGSSDSAAASASPPVPIGALYYNTTVGAVKVRLT